MIGRVIVITNLRFRSRSDTMNGIEADAFEVCNKIVLDKKITLLLLSYAYRILLTLIF